MIQTNHLATVEWCVDLDCRGHRTNLNHFITSVRLKKLSELSPPSFLKFIIKHFLWSFHDFSLVRVCMTSSKKKAETAHGENQNQLIKHGHMVKGHMNKLWPWTCRNSSIEFVSLNKMDLNEKRKFIVSNPDKRMHVGRVCV